MEPQVCLVNKAFLVRMELRASRDNQDTQVHLDKMVILDNQEYPDKMGQPDNLEHQVRVHEANLS